MVKTQASVPVKWFKSHHWDLGGTCHSPKPGFPQPARVVFCHMPAHLSFSSVKWEQQESRSFLQSLSDAHRAALCDAPGLVLGCSVNRKPAGEGLTGEREGARPGFLCEPGAAGAGQQAAPRWNSAQQAPAHRLSSACGGQVGA